MNKKFHYLSFKYDNKIYKQIDATNKINEISKCLHIYSFVYITKIYHYYFLRGWNYLLFDHISLLRSTNLII